MKTRICVIISAVILFAAGQAGAVPDDKIFTSSGQILPGEEWNLVYIYNDDTVVDMLGGRVGAISTFDYSTLNVMDGSAGVRGFDYSTINISGGVFPGAHTWNYSTINFYASGKAHGLGSREFGIANMYGGTVEHMSAWDSGVVNIYDGLITDGLWAVHTSIVNIYGGLIRSGGLGAEDTSIINVYGYDFNYDPTGGAYYGGQLTGFWLNGSPFALDLYHAETYSHINQVPEPSGLLILALGALFAKRCC